MIAAGDRTAVGAEVGSPVGLGVGSSVGAGVGDWRGGEGEGEASSLSSGLHETADGYGSSKGTQGSYPCVDVSITCTAGCMETRLWRWFSTE
jgi:hypothetical protein